jgi:hypothetical protein
VAVRSEDKRIRDVMKPDTDTVRAQRLGDAMNASRRRPALRRVGRPPDYRARLARARGPGKTNRYLATTAVALRGAARRFEASRGRGFAQDSHNPADRPVPARSVASLRSL